MSDREPSDNIHATAIVVGTTGLLFLGPSGSGKSARAFACLDEAAGRGLFAALVADDQVFVAAHGDRIIATTPETIAGLIELRGSGIAKLDHIARAVMHVAVLTAGTHDGPRLPDPAERIAIGRAGSLPCVRLEEGRPGLAALAALCPQLLRI